MSRRDEILQSMLHSPVRNYVLPGLTSWLVGGVRYGRVRMFVSERDTREWIVPHSHRFDFACLVLTGEVVNTTFHEIPSEKDVPKPNLYAVGRIRRTVFGKFGDYEIIRGTSPKLFLEQRHRYSSGQEYAMRSEEIHSISFSRGARVLFFEGPERVPETTFLEPWCDGRVVPTFTVEPWMFERDGAS